MSLVLGRMFCKRHTYGRGACRKPVLRGAFVKVAVVLVDNSDFATTANFATISDNSQNKGGNGLYCNFSNHETTADFFATIHLHIN